MNESVHPTRESSPVVDPRGAPASGLLSIVGFLVLIELVSGILEGYYTPIFTDIALHLDIRVGDVNWFEAAQLMLSAVAVPLLCRLGDLWGHKNVLLLSTVITAVGSWTMVLAPGFSTFLVGWALQGTYLVWLPLEVAIVYRRAGVTGRRGVLTRRATAVLVAGLQLGVVLGALTSGAIVGATSFWVVLTIPAAAVTIALVAIWWGVEDERATAQGGFDISGLALLTVGLVLVMVGLVLVRVQGLTSPWPWTMLIAGLVTTTFFVRFQATLAAPLIDVRLMASSSQWPVQLAAFLFGMSVLGAQIPLSTFVRADPATTGYGLGANASFVSLLIGLYVVVAAIGALLLPLASSWRGIHGALVIGLVLVSLGYGLFIFMHESTANAMTNMTFVGLGSGILVAAIPVAAAEGAPDDRTAIAAGMTNATKTVGGAISSAVFALALSATGSIGESSVAVAPMSGYLVVWSVCSISALIAALVVATTAGRKTRLGYAADQSARFCT